MKPGLRFLFMLAMFGLLWYQFGAKTGRTRQENTPNQRIVPAYALETLQYIDENGKAPDGYVGGRTFENREKRLPQRTPDGSAIRYREWDVHPDEPRKDRGPERLVTGSDQSAWFTRDHYRSFTKIR
jgi:ribonuclease T1